MKNANITLTGNKATDISLPVIFFKVKEYPGRVFAECPALGIVTDGKNLDDAKKMFEEAFSVWFEYVCEEKNIVEVLKELGWKITKNSVTPAESIETYRPITPLALKSQNLSLAIGA